MNPVPFTLQIGEAAQRQLRRYRVSIQSSIRTKLQGIIDELTAGPTPGRPLVAAGPPHRFYVWDGVRVSYQVNPVTRLVTVLELHPETG